MSTKGHDLHSIFADAGDTLHDLKMNNGHFRSLSEQYQEATWEIEKIEDGIEPSSDQRLEDLKKKRLALLDDIAVLVSGAEAD